MITFCRDLEKIDFEFVYSFLTTSYWSEGISRSRMKRAMENSVNVLALSNDKPAAYARIITDQATFAYLCDVFVIEAERGKGISKALMKYILAMPELQGIKRFNLATKDAHELYRQFGWTELAQPERYMEINHPGIYKTLVE